MSIPIAYELGVLTIVQLYVVGFAMGVLTVFFDVSYQSYLPSLVDREQLVEGNAKLQASQSAAQILGPGFGGYLVGVLTAPVAVIVDAVSYLASALFVFTIKRQRGADRQGRRSARQPDRALARLWRGDPRGTGASCSSTPTCG